MSLADNMSKRQDEIRLRKRINGWKGPVTGYEEFKCVLHVPAEGLVVYQILMPEGCAMTGAKAWCTTASFTTASNYLRDGCLFVIHAQYHLSQLSTKMRIDQNTRPLPLSWKDEKNVNFPETKIINDCPSLLQIFNLEDRGKYYQMSWTKASLVEHIKSLESPFERLRHLKGIIDTDSGELDHSVLSDAGIRKGSNKVWALRANDYRSTGMLLKPADLILFADDPSDLVCEHVRRFLPSGVKSPEVIRHYDHDQLSFLLSEEVPRKASA